MAAGRNSWRMAPPVIDPAQRRIVMRGRYWKLQGVISTGIVAALIVLAVYLVMKEWGP
jgi:hypothetical protein